MTATKPALLPAGGDGQFRQMLHDTLAFAARIGEMRARLGALLGLAGSAYTVLTTVAHLQGKDGVGVSAVARHLHLSGAAVTIEVNRLVKLGFVDKRTNPLDRRGVLLRVTARARTELERLTAVQAPANDTLFAVLDEHSFAVLARLTRELVPCADEVLDMPRPRLRQGANGSGFSAA